MTAKRSDEEWKRFVLDHWDEWRPSLELRWRPGAPTAPTKREQFLEHLDQWAKALKWPGSEFPPIDRTDKGFIIRRRPPRKDTFRRTIWKALGAVVQEAVARGPRG